MMSLSAGRSRVAIHRLVATATARSAPGVSRPVQADGGHDRLAIHKRMEDCGQDRRRFFELMHQLRQSPEQLNAADIVTSIDILAEQRWGIDRSSSWLIVSLKDRAAEIQPRELPKIVRALSRLPMESRSAVVNDIAAHASYQLRELSLISLASVLRGFAHMRLTWDVLWSSASVEIARRSSELCHLSFSNIFWALGVVQRPCTMSIIPALCLFGTKATAELNAIDVGSCLWAATRLDIRHKPFVSGLVERADVLAEQFDDIGLVRVMQALAYFSEKDAALVSRLSQIIAGRMDSMSADNIARIHVSISEFQADANAGSEIVALKRLAETKIKPIARVSNSSRDR